MYDTILLPVDGSPGAEEAVARAVAVARATDATVHSLYVLESTDLDALETDERETVREAAERAGRRALETVAERAGEVDVVREVREGVPHQVIADVAATIDADLVVMGTRGLTANGEVRMGSTTERVITYADVPVIAVPLAGLEWTDVEPFGPGRIVIPTDGSDVADRAAAHALELATYARASVDVIYVVDETVPALEDAPRSIVGLLREGGQNAVESIQLEARDRGLDVTTEVLRGVPEREILAYADGVDADLIAMGTRGRAAGDDRIIGSTTARVLRRSNRPVLTLG